MEAASPDRPTLASAKPAKVPAIRALSALKACPPQL